MLSPDIVVTTRRPQHTRHHAIEDTLYAVRESYFNADPATTDALLRATLNTINLLSQEQFKTITLLKKVKEIGMIQDTSS